MFFKELKLHTNRTALIDGELVLTYAELDVQCVEFAKKISESCQAPNPLIFLKSYNNAQTLIAYLTALQNNFAVLLLDPEQDQAQLEYLIARYQPNLLIENLDIASLTVENHIIAKDLALLLSTSGSTGSAKQVCLSFTNIHENAKSIGEYLPIQKTDKTITTLPFFYSYGLSVINSHLLLGACIVFNQASVMSREFWQLFKQHEITSFAGVPYSYDMLLRLRFDRMDLPTLRYFTQAGGKLEEEKVRQLAEYSRLNNKAFFVMYGQTEATARMAFLASERVMEKPLSVGRAIPGGRFILRDDKQDSISASNQAGELIYIGKNIMLGYSNGSEDLGGFCMLAELATGDIAYRDDDGDYFITGRKKRFIKLFGQRINLDEVEQLLAKKDLVTYCCGDDTKLIVATQKTNNIKALRMSISETLKIHHSVIDVYGLDVLPVLANGKKDYQAILALAGVLND